VAYWLSNDKKSLMLDDLKASKRYCG